MRRLAQKLVSWICALTMTASLTGTAFADTAEDGGLPVEAPPHLEAPADDVPPVVEATVSGDSGETAGDETPAAPLEEETPANDTMTGEENDAEEDGASEGADEMNDDGSAGETEAGETETGETETGETETQPEADGQPAADNAGAEAEPSANESPAAGVTANVPEEEISVQSAGGSETGEEPGEQAGQTPAMTVGGSEVDLSTGGSGDGWSYDAEDGSLVLVNCAGGEDVVVSDGGVTIKAAGLNHLTNLTVDGDITLIGTGILLIDEIELGEGSEFFLQPNSEIYGENGGSVAVFLLQEDGSYLLINGDDVPGILDEEYTIEGITLVIPSGSSLLLSSIGAKSDPDTDEVTYYHPGETAPTVGEEDNYVESAGQLTIGAGASLVVQTDAAVHMDALASAVLGNCFILPMLRLIDDAVMELYGNVEGSGAVEIGSDSVLTGDGRAEGAEITIDAPAAINNSGVTFSSGDMILNGSGELDKLRIEDSTVYIQDANLLIGELLSSGNDTVVLPEGANLHDITAEEQLTLMGWTRFAHYDESQTITIDGEVEGTVVLSSGLYDLSGANTDNAEVSGASPTLAEDGQDGVGGVPSTMLIQPGNLPGQTEDHQVSVTAAIIGEYPNPDNTFSFSYDHEVELAEDDSAVTLIQDGETLLLDLDQIKDIAERAGVFHGTEDETVWDDELGGSVVVGTSEFELELSTVVVELVYLDADGQVRIEFLKSSGEQDNISGTIDAENLAEIRIFCYSWLEKPNGSGTATETSTTFTGTGVLGNGGAGSVVGGKSTSILGGNSQPDNPDNPDKPDKPDPKPATETAKAAVGIVVWAEPAKDDRDVYVLRAGINGRELTSLVGRREVRMDYRPAAGVSTENLYVVFRNEDGSLQAVKARYDAGTGQLIFTAGRLGRFVVVGMNYDGIEFSAGFYEALGKLEAVKKLK